MPTKKKTTPATPKKKFVCVVLRQSGGGGYIDHRAKPSSCLEATKVIATKLLREQKGVYPVEIYQRVAIVRAKEAPVEIELFDICKDV